MRDWQGVQGDVQSWKQIIKSIKLNHTHPCNFKQQNTQQKSLRDFQELNLPP